jgi:hypothetical protein
MPAPVVPTGQPTPATTAVPAPLSASVAPETPNSSAPSAVVFGTAWLSEVAKARAAHVLPTDAFASVSLGCGRTSVLRKPQPQLSLMREQFEDHRRRQAQQDLFEFLVGPARQAMSQTREQVCVRIAVRRGEVYEVCLTPGWCNVSAEDQRKAATSALRGLVVYTLVLGSAEEQDGAADRVENEDLFECNSRARVDGVRGSPADATINLGDSCMLNMRIVYAKDDRDSEFSGGSQCDDACSVRALRPVILGSFQTSSCALQFRVYLAKDGDEATVRQRNQAHVN